VAKAGCWPTLEDLRSVGILVFQLAKGLTDTSRAAGFKMAEEDAEESNKSTTGVFTAKLEVMRKVLSWEEMPIEFFVDKHIDDDDDVSQTDEEGPKLRARLSIAKQSMKRLSKRMSSKRLSSKRMSSKRASKLCSLLLAQEKEKE